MKKPLILIALMAAAALFGACSLKSCYCCEAVGTTTTATAVETYTDQGRACNSISTSTRTCMEMSEQIDCSRVAIGYKRP
ncbi:MAG: hypothetical protein HUK17_02985 [Bacteroidales bacterium]|nr:hypothetical protein [Bacteroidales bacterium]